MASLRLDASEAIKLFLLGYEAAFIASNDFTELEQLLALYKITLNEH